MKILTKLKAKILSYSIVHIMKNVTGSTFGIDWIAARRISINHCVADKHTPKETILYIVGEKFREANHYDQCLGLQFRFIEDVTLNRNAENWYELASLWRDEGEINSVRFQEFISILDTAKARWPQLFGGEQPYVNKYWEVHYGYKPIGVATLSPAAKPVATFDEFADATMYVAEHSTNELWWHSYDLAEAARNENISKWEATTTPQQFKSKDKPGYVGYNSIHRYSADCIFAMPQDSYMNWLDAVQENDIYNNVLYDKSWCVRHVEHKEPIDNENPDANIPCEYLED